MKTEEILMEAINKCGKEHQIDICIEEMSELTKALIKDRRHGRREKQDWLYIIEELADVKIMIKQMEIIFRCGDKVDEQIDFKVNRLKERLESDENI